MATQVKKKFNWKFLLVLPIFVLFLVGLSACSGSAKLEGTYYTEDDLKHKDEIKITEDKITFKGKTFDYEKTGNGKQGSVIYFGIKFDGRTYSVIFPDSSDRNVAILMRTDGSKEKMTTGLMRYALNKEKTPNFEDYYKKYIKKK